MSHIHWIRCVTFDAILPTLICDTMSAIHRLFGNSLGSNIVHCKGSKIKIRLNRDRAHQVL